jgi:hypothetical protein
MVIYMLIKAALSHWPDELMQGVCSGPGESTGIASHGCVAVTSVAVSPSQPQSAPDSV